MSGVTGDNPYRASGVVDALAAGRTGTVNWQTGSIKTATFTATSSEGYFVNTTGGAITVNLPAGTAGDIVGLKDYAGTWDSNAVTLNPDGSDLIGGASAVDPTLESEGGAVLLVYVDGTQGWLTTQESVTASPSGLPLFTAATGGTPCAGATCGDYKIHTFTGPGTFCVSVAGSPVGANTVDYMVVAGGGGGGGSVPGYYSGGGGGAGGFRESVPSPAAWTASPIANPANARPISIQGYSITVGGGGAGGAGPGACSGVQGSTSTFSDIDSAGGGSGGKTTGVGAGAVPGGDGGSGGGGGAKSPSPIPGGSGDTPNVTPDQGFDGGVGDAGASGVGGGGGGALGAGVDGTPGPYGRAGGPGATTCISGSPVAYATGGASGTQPGTTPTTAANSGTGGQSGGNCASTGAAGGSGVVILRYKFQN